MLEKITPEEIDFIESLYNPVCAIECLFNDLDNLALFNEERFSHVRLAQFALLSYEYLLDYNTSLSEKENFKLREGAGNVFCFGGRKFGKTLCTEILDVLLSMFHNDADDVGFSSYDALHIRGILEKIIQTLENHPFFKLFEAKINRSPTYRIYLKNGYTLESVNMNLQGENPGAQFYQKHFKRLYVEEASFEPDEVNKKRLDSVSEIGCVLKGTKILLPDFSSKNIENIMIGETILGWNEKEGKLCETIVLNSFCSGTKDVVKISSNKNQNHVWLTQNHNILIKSPGMAKYRWSKCIRCTTTEFESRVFSFIENKKDYYEGILLGLIASDGHIASILNKNNTSFQISLYQADEPEFFKFVLNYLHIFYATDNAKKSPWGKKQGFIYRIKRENNDYIFSLYDKLKYNKDAQYGFISGFIVGDGWIDKIGNFHIVQSIKKIEQLKLLDNTLNILNIPFVNKFFKSKHISGKEIDCVLYDLNRWTIPFVGEYCKKVDIWHKRIFNNKSRIYVPYEKLCLKGFLEKQEVYDLTTSTNNFIANGFIIHNCVYRIAGMTNFTKYSPPGRIFYDLDKRKWLVNFPQYVNPNWDEKEDERATKEHGGKESLSYRIYVKGEIVEDGVSAIDMDRVRKNYDYKRQIKHFEIPKTAFVLFEDILIVERPVNAEYLYLCADIGESAPTEIVVITEVNKKYQYIYNITLYGLTDKEQFRIFTYLARKLNANYIALDCSEGTGRAIFRSLEEIFPKQNLQWVGFNEKIAIGFETDENNNTIFKDGNPIVREEYTEIWSIKRLRDLLYEEDKFRIPLDYKLDTQLNSLIAVQSGNRILYHCISPENHILSAFRVFFIAQWLNEFANSRPIQSKTFCKIGV